MICSRMLEGEDCEECEDYEICPIKIIIRGEENSKSK